MLVLTAADLAGLLAPGEVVEALADAFARQAAGRAVVPPRTAVPVGGDALLLVMPAAVGADPAAPAAGGAALGAKLVTFHPGNRARGLPTHLACSILLEPATGRLLALLDAALLTGLRTGATSALAARFLARPDSHRLACFGTSVQAGFQLRCLAAVLPVRHVTVLGRDPDRARAFAAAMERELGVAVEVGTDPARAVAGADVVTCATTSPRPLFSGRQAPAGVHVDAVGAFRPTDREVDTDLVRRARVVVESYDGVLATAGDLLIPLGEGAIGRDHVAAELAELVTGAQAGRTGDDEVTLFKSVGWALEDLAVARLAWDRARKAGVGTEVRW